MSKARSCDQGRLEGICRDLRKLESIVVRFLQGFEDINQRGSAVSRYGTCE
jgi:hypothetical protein